MDFNHIILCTDAPHGTGLAYYYYRALCDTLGPDKTSILDDGQRRYDANLIERGIRRAKLEFGLLSKVKYKRIMDELSSKEKVILILFNNAGLHSYEIRKLAACPDICLINYISDHPYAMTKQHQRELFKSLSAFHLVLIFSEALIPVLYQLGAKLVKRIPFGYCKYTHRIPAEKVEVEYPNKLFYFGTWTSITEQWLSYLLDFDLEIEGNGWYNASSSKIRSLATRKKPNTDHNMAILARKAGLVVNFTRAPHGCFHTMKTFELTVAGACVLSNYSKEQEEFFQRDKSMIYFDTPSEMVAKVDYFFKHPEVSETIRRQAVIEALPYSYHSRVSELLKLVKDIGSL